MRSLCYIAVCLVICGCASADQSRASGVADSSHSSTAEPRRFDPSRSVAGVAGAPSTPRVAAAAPGSPALIRDACELRTAVS